METLAASQITAHFTRAHLNAARLLLGAVISTLVLCCSKLRTAALTFLAAFYSSAAVLTANCKQYIMAIYRNVLLKCAKLGWSMLKKNFAQTPAIFDVS